MFKLPSLASRILGLSVIPEWVWSLTTIYAEPRKFSHLDVLETKEAGQEPKRKIKGNISPEGGKQTFLSWFSTANSLRGK